MQTFVRSLLAAAMVAAIPLSVRGDDGGWHMPNLNPFSSATAPAAPRHAAPPTSGWKMPKLWTPSKPQPKQQAKTRPHQRSTWQSMTSSTQKALSKTADALTPWDNKQPGPPPKLSGSNSVFTNKSTTIPAKKDPSVKPASWWGSEKNGNAKNGGSNKGDKDKTVNEFLSHPRLD
jgi:hypothetical protein